MGVIRKGDSEVTFRLRFNAWERASHAERQEKVGRKNNQCRSDAVENILTNGATERRPV